MMHLQQAWWGGEERAPWSLSKKEKKNLAKAWPRRPLLHQSQSEMLNHLLSFSKSICLGRKLPPILPLLFRQGLYQFQMKCLSLLHERHLSTVWKLPKFSSHHNFCQTFRESNVFTKELISRNIFSARKNFLFFRLCFAYLGYEFAFL